jgi:hypothetical protein
MPCAGEQFEQLSSWEHGVTRMECYGRIRGGGMMTLPLRDVEQRVLMANRMFFSDVCLVPGSPG